jgi:methylamine--corrinoid protein Co-methyltransferase
MTEMCYYETAETVTTSVVSGASAIEAIGVAKSTHIDTFTPMEARLNAEVTHAVRGMTRDAGNRIVKALLDKYESKLADAPVGKKYQDCWDVDRKIPHQEYADFDRRMKKDLSEMGIPF